MSGRKRTSQRPKKTAPKKKKTTPVPVPELDINKELKDMRHIVETLVTSVAEIRAGNGGHAKGAQYEPHTAKDTKVLTTNQLRTTKQLKTLTRELMWNSLSKGTASNYKSKWHHFNQFRKSLSLPLPATPQTIVLYVSKLTKNALAISTIRNYLSAVSFVHRASFMEDPTTNPAVSILCRGVTKQKTNSPSKPIRLPVTSDILVTLIGHMRGSMKSKYEFILYRALFIICYFACLRASEAVVSKAAEHTLMLTDITVHATKVQINFKSFKHSKRSSPPFVLHQKSGSPICPVRALQRYVKMRPLKAGPFFLLENGTPVNRKMFSSSLKQLARRASLEHTQFNTHSFRIGRATDLHQLGHSHQDIMIFGRWSSSAFKRYIRPNHITLSNTAL
ncbi:uncharacterized protein [Antedon mediterranea]|uniref:uncharacterized protein n=1 Tax=Antedon mediterranea TaxID=105859 RepID=UPI003AF76194